MSSKRSVGRATWIRRRVEARRNAVGEKTQAGKPRAAASRRMRLARGAVVLKRIYLAARVAYRVLKGLEQDPLALAAQAAEWVTNFL